MLVAAGLLLLVTVVLVIGLAVSAVAAIFTIDPSRKIGPFDEVGIVLLVICLVAFGLVGIVSAVLTGGFYAARARAPIAAARSVQRGATLDSSDEER
ncbi:MAG: hypothetical protein ABIR79_06550 [Candidatus Binatia bacterium]